MKCKCGGNLFTVQIIPCCSDCDQNPAHDGENYIYDQKEIDEKDLERSGVEDDGECKFGTAQGAGCYMFTCPKCHWKTNLYVSDSC